MKPCNYFHLSTGWQVDQAILSEEERVVIIRFGRDYVRAKSRNNHLLMLLF